MAKRFSLLAIAGVLIFWAIPQSVRAQEEVVIGIPLALTGMHARPEEQQLNGYKMALEEILAQGGIRSGVLKGKKLGFLFEDDEGEPEQAKAVTEKLITRDKLPMIMGGYASSEVYAIAGTTAQYGTPFLSPSGAADDITQKGWKNVFRLNQPASEYCTGLQDFMLKIVKPTSMGIIFENTPVGITAIRRSENVRWHRKGRRDMQPPEERRKNGLKGFRFNPSTAKAMREWGKENNVKVLMFEPYEAGNADFRSLMTRVKASRPEVIFMVSSITDAVLLTRQAAELNIDCKLFCGAGAGFALPGYITALGKLGEGVVSAALWSQDVKYPGAQKFYENFKNKFKLAPTCHAAEAYSAAYVMEDVLERTKSLSKEDLINALSETDMMTVFGPVKFVNYSKFTNQNRIPSLVVQMINGKYETIWPPEAASAQSAYPQPKWEHKR